MANEAAAEISRRLTLALTIDNGRALTDPFKLPASLRTDVAGDVANLASLDALTGPAEGARALNVVIQRRALDELERQSKGGYRFIAALDEDTISDAQRKDVYASYNWVGGDIGRFDDERRLAMGKQAVKVDAENLVDPAFRYPAARLARIQQQLALIAGSEDIATGGGREAANRLRNAALETAGTTLSRVRFYYCSASRDADQTPELARIEYQPRRDPGTVEHAAKPSGGGAGGATPP